MEEVFDAALVADEAESLVDEEPCDCPGRHTRSPPFRPLEDIPRGVQPATGRIEEPSRVEIDGRLLQSQPWSSWKIAPV